jgi:predicted enzyme related to lactoylglutathione lyase
MQSRIRLAQARLVTEDVERLAAFYADVLSAHAMLNPYYVEIAAGPAGVGFSRYSFTHYTGTAEPGSAAAPACGETILYFAVDDVDAHHARIDGLGVTWVLPPTNQPWGSRAATFRDPDGHLVNLYSRTDGLHR